MDAFDTKIESETRRKYSGDNGVYQPETITHLPEIEPSGFSNELLRFKFGIVEKYAPGAVVLDVGCGNGLHAIELAKTAKEVAGVDYSEIFVAYAKKSAQEQGAQNVDFLCGNARDLPYSQEVFDLAYCFAALYHMPSPSEVVAEISRVLKPGGRCVVEFGNLYSLNTIVCNQYPELAKACHIPVWEMTRVMRRAGFVIEDHYSFQVLPMWADRPRWLRPLLHPSLVKILSKKVGGKMLDQWISGLPLLRNFAFRHLVVAKKSVVKET